MENFKKVTNKTEMRLENIEKPPETAEQQVNCYGTYEIQPTADREDMYPAIAQGFNAKIVKNDCENEERRDNSRKSGKKYQ
ncbi:MAG: hypothetical protein E7545_05850 [Ruminococcaceae bacterium]|nr:hypothetical protein [Oscillospiraceae bacterium]